MHTDFLIGGIASAFLLVYLIIAIFFPEKF
jgi:K+-transporting ATPase KdpF subunit